MFDIILQIIFNESNFDNKHYESFLKIIKEKENSNRQLFEWYETVFKIYKNPEILLNPSYDLIVDDDGE